jgi:pimeloyl-ACP methyl ester carboxylesterase
MPTKLIWGATRMPLILSVLGEHSDPRFHQRQQLLLEWLPHVEPFILAGAGHLLHVERPTQLATALSSFFSRHSSGVAT